MRKPIILQKDLADVIVSIKVVVIEITCFRNIIQSLTFLIDKTK